MKPLADLGKPTMFGATHLFAPINIAIVDADQKIAEMVRRLLSNLGFNHIYIVHDGLDLLKLMQEEPIDIVVTEWETKHMGGLELATHLRQSIDSPNRMIPIIMLTGYADRAHIQKARDAGITEYVAKPFSAKTLLERIYAVVENPRGFVIAKNFIGPDRRRISSLTLPPMADETREYIERKAPVIVPKEHLSQLIMDDTPRIIMPDNALKKKIGIEVPVDIITHMDTITQSEALITSYEDTFIQAIMKEVATLEKAYTMLVQNPDHSKRLIISIKEAAFTIKSRAGTFGFSRATEVADLLHKFCQNAYDRENKYHLIILEKHIQTISVIFTHKIKGDGGEVGAELLKDLAKLIDLYLHRKD